MGPRDPGDDHGGASPHRKATKARRARERAEYRSRRHAREAATERWRQTQAATTIQAWTRGGAQRWRRWRRTAEGRRGGGAAVDGTRAAAATTVHAAATADPPRARVRGSGRTRLRRVVKVTVFCFGRPTSELELAKNRLPDPKCFWPGFPGRYCAKIQILREGEILGIWCTYGHHPLKSELIPTKTRVSTVSGYTLVLLKYYYSTCSIGHGMWELGPRSEPVTPTR